jgi:CubicO group peptidase (beta-lactamase class C family)
VRPTASLLFEEDEGRRHRLLKHVAAFGTLRLIADATIDLDTDVNDYLSSWHLPGGGLVTVRQVLAHTAGLSENWFPG